jgi:hypothetical protein
MAIQQGISGFVRIPDSIDPHKVYAIGPGGRPIADSADLMRATGASSLSEAWKIASVQIISPEQATKYAITNPEAKRKGTTPGASVAPVKDTVPGAGIIPSDDIIPIKGDDDKNTLTRFKSDPTPSDDTTNESTVWLYNSDTKTYIPIKNPES